MDCTIRYARFSSHHYTVPNPLSIDQLFSINKTMCRFISLIREMPDRKQVSVKTVLFAHNVDGLLFHLPLFHLLFHHLRGDNNSLEDSSLFDNNEGDLSDDKLTFSRLMSLNVIVDLSRLLTHGYSHLYTVYGFVHESLHPFVSLETGSTTTFPMTYWEALCQKYATYRQHPSTDETSENSVYYHSYLQSLQKFVYLMVIDDYLSVLPFPSSHVQTVEDTVVQTFSQWLEQRPEIQVIIDSLDSPTTKVFAVKTPYNRANQTLLVHPTSSSVPFVYKHINGLVLNLNSIIKDDYFPGSRNTPLVGSSYRDDA